ncbi:MAG: LEA type 2 family protein, partial [Clostridia bacterium]|nr:LEA type 2 family protein [Deltaproteobacteria bacterium]
MRYLAFAFLALTSCAQLKDIANGAGIKSPEVTFDKVTYRAADFEALHCDIAFDVHNPNRVGGHFEGYAMKLVVDNLTIADGEVAQPLNLGPGATTSFVIPTVIKWAEVASLMSSKPSIPEDLSWTASGRVNVKIADQVIGLPFSVDGKLPVIRTPSIEPVALRVTSASFTKVGVAVDLAMKSTGGHTIAIGEMTHAIALSG